MNWSPMEESQEVQFMSDIFAFWVTYIFVVYNEVKQVYSTQLILWAASSEIFYSFCINKTFFLALQGHCLEKGN